MLFRSDVFISIFEDLFRSRSNCLQNEFLDSIPIWMIVMMILIYENEIHELWLIYWRRKERRM